VFAFAIFLIVCSAVPVLAAEDSSPPGNGEVGQREPESPDRSDLPDGADIARGVEQAEEKEVEWQAWLEGPIAAGQRQDSRTAYTGLDAASAEALLRTTFAKQLEELNNDPARVLSDAQLIVSTEEASATIRDEGDTRVLESSVPVKTENDEGDIRKVDVGLEPSPEGFETENALVDLQIPKSPDEPVSLGEEGVGIKLAGADEDRVGRLFGDGNVFTPEVLTDTDMLVSPIATGVEVFNILRSQESPETFRYQVQMPPGAELRVAGEWGVEVVKDGETLSRIYNPTAIDAQGTDVPVDLQVDGSSLIVTVEHHDADYAMPILLDPSIEENDDNWIVGEHQDGLAMWEFSSPYTGSIMGSTNCIYECFGPGGPSTRGLFVSLEGGHPYPANWFGQWVYGPPNGNSYISMVRMGFPYLHADHNCSESEYPLPKNFFGVWSKQGFWVYLSINSANQPGGTYTLPYSGDAAVMGLTTGGGISYIPCWRDLYAGGASVWLDDWNPPSVSPVQNPPVGWVKNTSAVKVVSQASDEGLGVQKVVINPDGAPTIYDKTANQCSGTRRSPCLTGYTATFEPTGASFSPGKRTASVVAFDASGKASNPYYIETKVDALAPEVVLNGQLAEATEEDEGPVQGAAKVETLRLPVYNLAIEAKDGVEGNPEPKTWQSGVKNIEVSLDKVKQTVPWSAQTCAAGHDCAMSKTYQLKLGQLQGAGKHTLEITVTDNAGNPRVRNIEFEYFPATGMKDEYVMQYFPLPDGSDESAEEHPKRPELAVNVMNGNLVYRETDVDVDGAAAVPLEVERYYNSMLPPAEDTEWGDGWTLSQTPELTPLKTGGSPTPNQAEIVDESGDIEGGITLPTQVGASKFDPDLQATVTKTAAGGYELSDETGESTGPIVFDSAGQAESLQGGGYAEVDYDHEAGTLSQIEVKDPATFTADPAELEIPDPQLVTQPQFAGSFGSVGSGNGQMKAPADVAVDTQGNVWVVDKSNNRIEKFDAAGKFVAAYGSAGAGNGQFNRPTAIALTAKGELLVTDAGNCRVQRFSSAGAYMSQFGTQGTGNGQFTANGPEGIAVDASGNIWVSDTSAGRIEKFSSAGAFLLAFGTKGSGSGQLGKPAGLDIAPTGEIWVADRSNSRVSVFTSGGVFKFSFGSLGGKDGQFVQPSEVEIDNLGNVWVGDLEVNRVQEFDLSGQFKAKFGGTGSGPGKFNLLSSPLGIAADREGHLWITDVNNNRIQQWSVPIEKPGFVRSFGGEGSGDGKLSVPGDVAVGVEGNLWVVDKGHNRIQRFDQNGVFVSKFGSPGSGDGQFNRPTAIAVDRDGSLLVADSGNNRIEKFDSQGQFVSKFGSVGTGQGQLSSPEGIATDYEGDIWVADSGNGRVQKFDEEGKFLAVVGSKGSGQGQFSQPIGIDVDPNGNVWIADLKNNRISVFKPSGEFAAELGSLGTGPGQFNRPSGVEVDPKGNVWVVDQNNQRVQRFDLEGKFVGQFGSAGVGEGQFQFPTANSPAGIAVDSDGHIWVTDVNNMRIQRWQLGNYQAPPQGALDLNDGDPKVEVESSGGLVTEVTGNAAGTNTYTHTGDDLTANKGPDGESKYVYDPAGRMTKVTLPNGTSGSITYTADGRVRTVTVDPAGTPPAKTTEFEYQDAPSRRTTVVPPDAPHITFDIGADGSVLKWWNTAAPPTIEPLGGNLFDNRGEVRGETPMPPGDYALTVNAYSAEGISSIQVIADSNHLVDEATCAQDPNKPGLECITPPPDQWVMETGGFSPGIHWIEVLVTDRLGAVSSQRFWINVPQPPPPSIGAPVPPKFKDIKKFREDFGLEVVFPVKDEIELNERIFNLIGAWNNPHSPAGEVARASWERWGVPLRPEDVAEMEYRESYLANDIPAIEEWAQTHRSTEFAGYYVDHRAGGILHVGFTANQQSALAEVEAIPGLSGSERLAVFASQPANSRMSLKSTMESVDSLWTSDSILRPLITGLGIDEKNNVVEVGGTDPAQIDSRLKAILGPTAPIQVGFEEAGIEFDRRNHLTGRMLGGESIWHDSEEPGFVRGCTVGFGAWERQGTKPNGQPTFATFLLTQGHCTLKGGTTWYRANTSGGIPNVETWQKIGGAARTGFVNGGKAFETDTAAIRLKDGDLMPRYIYKPEENIKPVEEPGRPSPGEILCFSAPGTEITHHPCGEFVGVKQRRTPTRRYVLVVRFAGMPGDSGGPVWSPHLQRSVGTLLGGPKGSGRVIDWVTPLLNPRGWEEAFNQVPGALNAPGMGNLTLAVPGG
jgi:tripartite motif-containing protein 71